MVKTAFVAIFLFIIGVSGTIALTWKLVNAKPRRDSRQGVWYRFGLQLIIFAAGFFVRQ